MDEMDEDVSHRPNALFITGDPIANLPTKSVFSYAAYYDVVPLGLEWIDDRTCVLVFKTRAAARSALQTLARSDLDESGLHEARPLPTALWPLEDRVASVLGQARAGTIHIRWAEPSDVKKSGAREASVFYKKHGETAGKEVYRNGVLVVPEIPHRDRDRHHEHDGRGRDNERARLDAELDAFISGNIDDSAPRRRTGREWDRGKPPRRRSSRSASPPRRRHRDGPDRDGGLGSGRGRRGRDHDRTNGRPQKSLAELDAELEAFLAER
ncbi:hypothetical protein AURDEDRAFT_141909 [Auricularia subglabra TFB-10046 SS5]|nr:hypothetical protein AURDEDRAFT_141909 [Auricularia subglabra TFB-10046 SS5]